MKTNAITLAMLLAGLTVAQAQNTTASPEQTPTPPTNAPTFDGPRDRGFAKGDRKGPGKFKGDRMRNGFGPQGGPGQQGPGGPGQQGPGRPGKMGKMNRKGGPEGREHGLLSLTTVTGTVGQLTSDDDYMLNGFTLSANAGPAVNVVFHPHMGLQVQKAIKAGSTVSVSGFSDQAPSGETRFHMTSLTAGKTTVLDGPPATQPSPPPAPVMTTVTGKISDYKFDRNGRVSGLVLSDNSIVRIPPHVAYQLTNLAQKGTDITVQGYTRTLGEGQVQLQKANILRASVLTINGQQYLVR